MKWISCETNKRPLSPWHVVFVTDGEIVCLAHWIEDPKYWYGDDLMEWDEMLETEVPLDEEWHLPHWRFITEVGPFSGNDECFGIIEDVTHWISLPKPPKKFRLE